MINVTKLKISYFEKINIEFNYTSYRCSEVKMWFTKDIEVNEHYRARRHFLVPGDLYDHTEH